ncbi:MAG: hypothetical protein HY696_04155 [Deltaproteobacteria bacterium]|nr:hypothetical protein [Deltaproteobacteria bacterium]
MQRTVPQLVTIGVGFGCLCLVIGCGGAGGTGTNSNTALSVTQGGYPDVSGTYQVTDSSCDFADVSDDYDVDQDDSILSIGRVYAAASGVSTTDESPANTTAPVIPSIGAPSLKFGTRSKYVATISQSGAITLIADQGTEQFTCTANAALPLIPFSCTSRQTICAFIIEQTEPGSSNDDATTEGASNSGETAEDSTSTGPATTSGAAVPVNQTLLGK